MRPIVFCADDLGMGPDADEGIVRAVGTGLVREVSLCVTGPHTEASLRRVTALGASIGLHLSLTFGRALTGPIVGLTDARGRFHGLGRVLARARFADPERLRAEVRAQLERLRQLGVEPTHLNGHHHVHVFPGVRDAVLGARSALYLRVPASAGRSARGLFLSALGRSFRRRAGGLGAELLTLACVGLDRRSPSRILESVPGALEWVVHPRAGQSGDDGGGWLGARAADDLRFLESRELRELIRRHDARACTFSEAVAITSRSPTFR